MYSVIVSFGVIASLSFPISIVKGIFGAYATAKIKLAVSRDVAFLKTFFSFGTRSISLNINNCPQPSSALTKKRPLTGLTTLSCNMPLKDLISALISAPGLKLFTQTSPLWL